MDITRLLRGISMSIAVLWDNTEQTIIRYDFEGQWVWSEFFTATQQAFALTRSVPHTVDSISNFKPGAALPSDALFQFRRAMASAPPNRGVTVIVGGSTLIKTMVIVFGKINRQLGERLFLADTLDQARALLAARHTSADQTKSG
jgi:hypothetical protein